MTYPSWTRRIAFVTCLLAVMCETANMTVVVALFTNYALDRGLNQIQVGLVFGMTDFTSLVGQMTIAPVITSPTRKFFFATGILISGTSLILFGFSAKELDLNVFFVLCVCCRFTMGIGASLVLVGTVPMVIQLYPEKAAIVSSTAQIFLGLGGLIGAPLGSALSTLAKTVGFDRISFPYYSFGVFQICLLISSVIFIPPAKHNDNSASGLKRVSKQQFYSLIAHKNLWFVIMPLVFILVSVGYTNDAYPPYFEDTIGVDNENIGYIFVPLTSFFGISSLFWGYLTQHGNVRVVVVCAIVMGALYNLLFFLPAVFPSLENWLYALSVSSVLGIALSAAFTSAHLVVEKVAEFNGFKNVEMNRLMAAGCYSCIRSGGRIIGAFLFGGVILQQLDFYFTCLLQAFLSTFFGIIAVWQLWKIGLFQLSYYTLIEDQSSDCEVSLIEDRDSS